MIYQEIKQKRQQDYDNLLKSLGVFWAFSQKQFNEGKTPLKEGEKYVSIGMGGYCPKHNADALIKGAEDIEKKFKAEVKENKMREAHILYELNNHECFYTGRVEDAMGAIGEGYTKEEVGAVFNKNAKKYNYA